MFKLVVSVVVLVASVYARLLSGELPDLEIVGGDPTDILQHPWQIALLIDDIHKCGGSIISHEWILTAAHCVKPFPIQEMSIKVGTSYLLTGGEYYNVTKAIYHAEYDSTKSSQNDIAVIKVDRPIHHPNASAINLPPRDLELDVGTNVTITGWGYIHEILGPLSSILLEVTVPIVSNEDCLAAYAPFNRTVIDGMLCAGLLGIGGKDACSGDSGGPLAIEDTLYGIVSWGYGCAEPNYPGVYTKVSKYIDWIKNHTGV